MRTKEIILDETNTTASSRNPDTAMCYIELAKLEVEIDLRDALVKLADNVDILAGIIENKKI